MIPIDHELEKAIFIPRNRDVSKWDMGHALLIAGSKGKLGAAILCSSACLHSGVGLVTAHIPSRGEIPLHIAIPEAMVSLDANPDFISEIPDLGIFSAIGVGPGIGRDKLTIQSVERLLRVNRGIPMVLDADALNILGQYPELQSKLTFETVLTPHIREFFRLVGRDFLAEDEIDKIALSYSADKRVILVLKSSRTRIFLPSGEIYVNTSGNSGLAKGGSGDVLTGMITSFLAQGYTPRDAAILGVYLHGCAADIAVCKMATESLDASAVINAISDAFLKLRMD